MSMNEPTRTESMVVMCGLCDNIHRCRRSNLCHFTGQELVKDNSNSLYEECLVSSAPIEHVGALPSTASNIVSTLICPKTGNRCKTGVSCILTSPEPGNVSATQSQYEACLAATDTFTGGLRYAAGKPRYDLIPPAPLKALAEHFAAGSTKYAERNWEAGMDWGHMIRAADSHFTEWKLGHSQEVRDPQMPEGYRAHHLIAAIWNLWCLYEYERRDIGRDTRPVSQFNNPQENEV